MSDTLLPGVTPLRCSEQEILMRLLGMNQRFSGSDGQHEIDDLFPAVSLWPDIMG